MPFLWQPWKRQGSAFSHSLTSISSEYAFSNGYPRCGSASATAKRYPLERCSTSTSIDYQLLFGGSCFFALTQRLGRPKPRSNLKQSRTRLSKPPVYPSDPQVRYGPSNNRDQSGTYSLHTFCMVGCPKPSRSNFRRTWEVELT